GDRYRFRARTDFQNDVDAERLRYGQQQVLANEGLESSDGYIYLVGAGGQLGKSVVTGCRSGGLKRGAGIELASHDRGTGDDSAGCVGDRARDGTAVALCGRDGG